MRKNIKRRPVIAGCLACLLLVLYMLPASAGSADPDDALKTPVRMGFFEFGGMFEGAEEEATKSGYCYEYMMQVSNYTGWQYTFCYGSYAELYEKLKAGEIDILPYTNHNEQRGQEVLFSERALVDEEYYLVAGPERSAMSDPLDGAVISTVEGADYNDLLEAYLSENGYDAEIRYYAGAEETWDALRNGDVNVTVFTSNAYSHDPWEILCSFGTKPTYIAVAQGRQDLLDALNEAAALIEIENSAFLGDLYASYFSDNPVRKSLTAEEQKWIEAHPVLHIGGFLNDAPYICETDAAVPLTGLTVDVINGIIDRLELDVTAEFHGYLTLAEMEEALDRGEVDAIIPFYPSYYIAQQHNLIISNTVRVSNMELVYRRGTSVSEAMEAIATPSTKLGIFYVQDTFPDSRVIGATSIQDAVDLVRDGKATGAIAQNVVLHNIKEKYDDLDYVVLSEGCGTCFAARPYNYALIRILNRGLNYYSNAEISAIASEYSLSPNVTTLAYLATHKEAVVLLIVIFAALVALVFALFQVNHLKKKANDASRAKTSFLFNMSHDIRTPMNAIQGFTRMAKKNAGDPEKLRDYLDKIDVSGQQLLTLVNQVLEMARIESGKLELTEEPVDISRAFDHSVTVLAEQANAYGLEFRYTLQDAVHTRVLADTARMNSITLNIAGNALKYTPQGGTIDFVLKEIPARKEGCATYVLSVSDTGIGMTKEFQQVLFEPFTREKTSTVSKIQGAGLGLAIVKKFVDLMGGDIQVHSEPGEGTRFDITIDFRIDPEGEKAEHTEEMDFLSLALENRRALLVDDNALNREIAADILTEEGITVEEAGDGSEAVKLLREKGPHYYDFILMDVQMPVMGGYEATKQIRELYPDVHIPIIALSANAFAEDRSASLKAGMDDHVAKPIRIRDLFGALEKILS